MLFQARMPQLLFFEQVYTLPQKPKADRQRIKALYSAWFDDLAMLHLPGRAALQQPQQQQPKTATAATASRFPCTPCHPPWPPYLDGNACLSQATVIWHRAMPGFCSICC